MDGRPRCLSLKESRPCREPTGAARQRSSSQWPRWTTSAPAARCSTRNSPPSCSQATQAWTSSFIQLIRTFFRLDGHHVQFNVVDAATLHAAQENPEQHRDLIVRVAGYSDYFCDLGKVLQDEIIARTEHQSF